jgi:hypothetical protein
VCRVRVVSGRVACHWLIEHTTLTTHTPHTQGSKRR